MMNFETNPLPELSFFTKVKMAVVAGVILCVGFVTSIFVLTISAIMLPFAAIGMWFLQKSIREQLEKEVEQADVASAQ